MRLVCPNCSAQYEIDGSMSPDEGRDVPCSNCGHTWFELPPPAADFDDMGPEDFGQSAAEPEIDDDDFDDEALAATSETDTPEDTEPGPDDDQTEAEQEPSDSDDDDDDDLSPSGAVAAAAAAAMADEVSDRVTTEPTTLKPRRPADAAALDILREEAEREMSQRRAPPSETIETQTDLGLEEIRRRDTPSRALRARMAHLGEDEATTTTSGEARTPSEPETYEEPRRDLLPDIDEINSTLKPANGAAGNPQGNGFLTGFVLMMLITAALIVAYAQAPAIARTFPDAEGALITYVDRANAVRDWIGALFNG